MKQKTPKSSLKILDQTFPLHARVRALSLFWSSFSSPPCSYRFSDVCIQLGRITNVHVLLPLSLSPSLSLSSLLRSKIITVKSTIIMGDFSSLTPQRKKERRGGEQERKRRRNYTQEETAKAGERRRGERGEIGSNVANGSRMLGGREEGRR